MLSYSQQAAPLQLQLVSSSSKCCWQTLCDLEMDSETQVMNYYPHKSPHASDLYILEADMPNIPRQIQSTTPAQLTTTAGIILHPDHVHNMQSTNAV
jgi:hypothetical protein